MWNGPKEKKLVKEVKNVITMFFKTLNNMLLYKRCSRINYFKDHEMCLTYCYMSIICFEK